MTSRGEAHSVSPGLAPAIPPAPPGSAGAWVAAAIVIAISLLSTFTIATDPTAEVAAGGSAGSDAPRYFVDESGNPVGGETDGSGGGRIRRVTGLGEGGDAAGSAGTEGQTITEGGTEGRKDDPTSADRTSASADCRKGQNAGPTDTGVTDSQIRFAATVVRTGIAKEFLADAQYGMEAVIRKQNAKGGVCGRRILVDYDDDGWVPSTGQQFIRGYITEDRYFGLAVNPSSEGLLGASQDVRAEGMPVIGADGMLLDQYENPWIWPVATSTHSVMHIMCMDAYERARAAGITNPTFALVWENNYRFGVEGAKAFKGCVSRRSGAKFTAEAEIKGGNSEYGVQANKFVGDCKGEKEFDKCDFVALLLEPETAFAWHNSKGLGSGKESDGRPRIGFGAPQPLFVNAFAEDCGLPCANLRVWTSFKPHIPPFDKDPAVQTYINDLKAVSRSADADNPHVQGAYVGMRLVVHALEEMGAAPTRERARELLDATTFDSGLAPPLTFSPGNHFAAVSAQAFEATYNIAGSSAQFTGWTYTNSGFKKDTELSMDR
jgi:ABC-type branched-subunit amino acid transport system substrate-binding protein